MGRKHEPHRIAVRNEIRDRYNELIVEGYSPFTAKYQLSKEYDYVIDGIGRIIYNNKLRKADGYPEYFPRIATRKRHSDVLDYYYSLVGRGIGNWTAVRRCAEKFALNVSTVYNIRRKYKYREVI